MLVPKESSQDDKMQNAVSAYRSVESLIGPNQDLIFEEASETLSDVVKSDIAQMAIRDIIRPITNIATALEVLASTHPIVKGRPRVLHGAMASYCSIL